MKDFFSRLVFRIKCLLSHGRNYGCLAEDASDSTGKPASNRPESANSIEKGDSLR